MSQVKSFLSGLKQRSVVSATPQSERDALYTPESGNTPKAGSLRDELKAQGSLSTEWLPYTLRWYLIWIPTALSFILGLVTILLYWHSNRNNGLGPEASAMVGWKFVPTLIAVIYAQLTTMLFNDIQRTEPFARLARPSNSVPPASRTILEKPRQIWTVLAHAFNVKHNGGKRSWIIISACLVNLLATIPISTLSSALLASELTETWQPFEMKRLVPQKDSTLKPFVNRDTFFRTTGVVLQNVTTSPWLSDEYSILPYWPSDHAGSRWDRHPPSTPEKWRANTTVFHNDFQCTKLDLVAKNNFRYNWTTKYSNETDSLMSVRLDSPVGCQYNLTFNASTLLLSHGYYSPGYYSGLTGSWAPADKYVTQSTFLGAPWNDNEAGFHPIIGDKCDGDEVIILATQWLDLNGTEVVKDFPSNFTLSAHMCRSKHTMAVLPVEVSASSNTFDPTFDEELFKKIRSEVPDSFMNHSQFLEMYDDPDWYTFIPYAGTEFSGALAVLATQYNFDHGKMMNATDLPMIAARIRRRHFGEILRSSLDSDQSGQAEDVIGSRVVSERRITIRVEAAATLTALLFCSFLILLWITWLSRPRQRPLHLAFEPATVLGTASLITSGAAPLASLQDLDQATAKELKSSLKHRYFRITDGHLKEDSQHGGPGPKESVPQSLSTGVKEAPAFVKMRILSFLALYIAALIIAVAVVYTFSNRSALEGGLFTYHIDLNALGHLGTFTPFSIIPTTLAVLLGLWWNGLDSTFRTIQPYITMSKSPTQIPRGAYVSYQSSYWLWATGKASKNRHWLLALVTLGTFVAQAFIISMAALFEQTTSIVQDSVKLERHLELRQIPHIRMAQDSYPPRFGGYKGAYGYDYVGTVLKELFSNLTTNWLYSGVIQATLDSPEPTWSRDGWNFVPIHFSILDDIERRHAEGQLDKDDSVVLTSSTNITLITPAIRGRLECKPVPQVTNTSAWLQKSEYYNTSMYLPMVYSFGGALVPDNNQPQCCFNHTRVISSPNNTDPVVIGYWTQNMPYNISSTITRTVNNFTVRWIYGEAGPDPGKDYGSVYFPKPPKIQAVKCIPIFETSEAEIVVDKATERIQSYRLLQDPTPDPTAWSDEFVIRNLTDQSSFPELKTHNFSDTENMLYLRQNITTSYGVLFMNSLLRASRLNSLSDNGQGHGSGADENLMDNAFNIRDNITGLTLDFMSYASFVRSGRDPEALLDKDVLLNHTQEVFSTFFTHFASGNSSLTTGGWVYQPIGANLGDLGPPAPGTFPQNAPDGTPAINISSLQPQNTQHTITAVMSTRIEVLRMNQTAFWVCLALLIWLVLTTFVLLALQRWYLSDLHRNVESLADILVLIAGSEKLLGAVRQHGVDGLRNSDLQTRLGWFRTENGKMRWGIEIVEKGEVLIQ